MDFRENFCLISLLSIFSLFLIYLFIGYLIQDKYDEQVFKLLKMFTKVELRLRL